MGSVVTPGGRVGSDDPFGKPGGPGLFKVKGLKLPRYVRIVAHGLLKGGHAKSVAEAIQMAIGILRNWAAGKGKVRPQVRAAAAAAVAEWEKDKGVAHASK